MNIIDERNVRTIHRKLKKKEYDDVMQLSTSGGTETVRLLDEGMVVDAAGRPLFYLMKGTLEKYLDALSDDYVGSINLGHMDFATFPFLIGQWTKKDMHLVDIGDGRKALDVDLRLDEQSFIVKELRRMPYTIGVSAEFSYKENEEYTKQFGLEIIDEIFIYDFAIVGDAGNVNSSGIRLSEGGTGMTVKELQTALDNEQVSDLDALNKKLDALLEGDEESVEKTVETEEVQEEEPAEEPAEEAATEEAAVEEEPAAEEAPAAEDEAPAEGENTVLAKAADVLTALQKENAELKDELAKVQAQLSTKAKAEKEFLAKFKDLSISLGTERVATGNAEKSAENVYFTDGIGEV